LALAWSVMMLWGPLELGVPIAITIGLTEGILGATIATFLAGEFGQAALRKKILPGKKTEEEKKKEAEEKKKEDKSKKKGRESPDFTVELVASDGATADVPVSKFIAIPPPFKEKFTKLAIMDEKGYEKEWEPVF
jgi:hypothetical protein